MGTLLTTCKTMTGGEAPVAGVGRSWRLQPIGAWALDDHFTLTVPEQLSGRAYAVGYGPFGGTLPNWLKTFKQKLYAPAGTALFFSALQSPEVFNDPNGAGNSFIEMANELGFADDLVAVAVFRRYLAVFGRRHVQIWAMDPEPAENQNIQTLENSGTVNGGSVQSIGTLDVLHCTDAGVRSLAARANSEDALVTDLGSPIDALIQAALAANGIEGLCSVVEPRTNRYWLAIGGTIYVFTYFPSAGISAWSTYTARNEAGWRLRINGGDETGTISIRSLADNGDLFWLVQNYPWHGSNEQTAADLAVALANAVTAYQAKSTQQTFDALGNRIDITNAAGSYNQLGQTTIQTAGNFSVSTERRLSTFYPKHFALVGNQVFIRDTNNVIYRYGGADGNCYDGAPCTWETPWLDARTPATQKWFSAVDAGMEGGWVVKAGYSPKAGAASLREIYRHDESSFDLGRIGGQAHGHFFKLRGETTGAEYARFGLVAQHFERSDAS